MKLNILNITDEDIKKLEDKLFEEDPILANLKEIRHVDSYIEFHADGVKEVKCDFCEENCGNDYCYTNRKEEQ